MSVFKKIHMIVSIAFYNFYMWHKNTRIIATFILSFILCFLLTDKTVQFARTHETTMQLVEAFVWTFGDSNSILLISLLLLLLFADMPFISAGTPLYLVRTTRKLWVAGQLLYTFLSTVIYLSFVLLSTSVLCMRYAFIKNTWSRTAAILAYSEEGEEIALPAFVKTLEMSRPYQCMAVIFILMLSYTLVMVFLMLLFNLWKGQIAGVCSVVIFSTYGLLLNPENLINLLKLPVQLSYKARVFVGWISPLNHATYHMHNFGYDNLPTITQTLLIFGGLFLILIAGTIGIMKKYNFQFRGTEG